MAATDITALSKVLKVLYPQRAVMELLYESSPLIGMLPKDEGFKGKRQDITMRVAPGTGRSSTFARAQANKGASTYAQAQITTKDEFGLFSIDGKAIRAAKGNPASLIPDVKADGDAILLALQNAVSTAIYGNGGGSLGQISSGSASEVLTLTDGTNMHYFTVGMIVTSSSTDGTTGSDDAERIAITAVDPDAKTITKAAGSDWNASGNFATSDHLFVDGDFGAKMTGLAGWIPSTTPGGSDSFFEMNRSVAPHLLAGTRYTASVAVDGDVTTALVNTAAKVHNAGGKPDSVFMNSLDHAKFVNQIEGKTQYTKMSAQTAPQSKIKVAVSYSAIEVMTGSGPLVVYADPWCPLNKCYMLTLKDWTLASMGPLLGWLDEDNVGNVLRETSANAYEGRMGGYMQLYTDKPAGNAVIDLTAVL